MIEKADGDEAKGDSTTKIWRVPEPKVLMQEIENRYCEYKQYSFHTFRCLVFDVKADLQLTNNKRFMGVEYLWGPSVPSPAQTLKTCNRLSGKVAVGLRLTGKFSVVTASPPDVRKWLCPSVAALLMQLGLRPDVGHRPCVFEEH